MVPGSQLQSVATPPHEQPMSELPAPVEQRENHEEAIPQVDTTVPDSCATPFLAQLQQLAPVVLADEVRQSMCAPCSPLLAYKHKLCLPLWALCFAAHPQPPPPALTPPWPLQSHICTFSSCTP